MKIIVHVDNFVKNTLAKGVLIARDTLNSLNKAIARGFDFVELDSTLIEKSFIDHLEYREFMQKLYTTTSNNNKGIEFEKNGQTDAAIKVYEENIGIGYTATHSYNRLMKIYPRLKRYDDELRVIRIAIDAFGIENETRFKYSIENPLNADYIEEIKNAHEENKTVRRLDGWVAYSPYPVMKWIERLDRAQKLANK